MYEYVCEHLIPGCTHKETGDTPERVHEKAMEHLHEKHGTEYIDGNASEQVMNVIVGMQAR